MQVVILAAGLSSRFAPFASDSHKSMTVLCGQPIIGWTLDSLKKAKIKEVVVIISPQDKKIKEYLKKYKGLSIRQIHQPEAKGMGNALLCVEKLLKEQFWVIYAHLVNAGECLSLFKNSNNADCDILADITQEPWKYGILKIKGKKAVGIIEKPVKGQEPSKIRASGVYLLNQAYLRILKETPEEEYSFEIALDRYMKQKKVNVILIKRPIIPLKYSPDLFQLKDYLLEQMPAYKSPKCSIASTAKIKGKAIIEEGVTIGDYALIEGPVYIGKNALVGAYCILRGGSVLEEEAQIERYLDCARSIIGKNTHLHSGFIGDSIIGADGRVGANLIVANRRIDRQNISFTVQGKKVSFEKNYLGVVIGDKVKIGINVMTMPGTIIGAGSIIGPATMVSGSIQPKTLFYTDYSKTQVFEKVKS